MKIDNDQKKKCPTCGKFKGFSCFHKGNGSFGLHGRCKRCAVKCNQGYRQRNREKHLAHRRHRFKTNDRVRERQQAYKEANREKLLQNRRRRRVTQKGMDWEVYLAKLKQGCEICGRLKKTLCIDHCHETGKIRGLLCNKCNGAIGLLGDNPKLVRRALKYLKHHANT